MDITSITQAIQRDGLWVVFMNVLLQQIGLPVPAVPTLLVAGSLAASSGLAGKMLAAAVLASILADCVWYLAGRAFGYRVLSGLCTLSINPGSCVSQTERRFIRWGAWSLVVAKFVPGFSTVAPPIAGSLRMPPTRFIVAAAAGAALWAGTAILVGWWLRDEVQTALEALTSHTGATIAVVAGALGAWLLFKLWQKYRFERSAAIAHITPAELMQALASSAPPAVLDLRGAAQIAQDGLIEHATPTNLDNLSELVSRWPKNHEIVTLCACPQDAGAVHGAHVLMKLGYLSVRPLAGGYDAWIAQVKASRNS